MKNKILFTVIIILVIAAIFVAFQFVQKITEDNFDEQLRATRDAYYCDAYPGDPPLIFGIVRENQTGIETLESYCEKLPDCEWHALVDKISGRIEGYSCCPKDLFIVPRQREYPDSVLGRCLVE